MYRKMSDFLGQWEIEGNSTIEAFERITDEAAGASADNEGFRSLRELAWHLTTVLGGVPASMGLTIDTPSFDAPTPATMNEIIAAYRRAAPLFAETIRENWTDEMLTGEIELWGSMRTRGFILLGMLLHQAHHRGQMTAVMRSAGLVPPGIYGPTREAMAAMRQTAEA